MRLPTWIGVLLMTISAAATAAEVPIPDVAAGAHPRLVFGADDIGQIRRNAATETGRAMVARLKALLAEEPEAINIGFHAAGHGLLYRLEDDPKHAAEAKRLVEMTVTDQLRHRSDDADGTRLWDSNYKMIMRTDPAVGVALAYDLCHDSWDADFRQRIAGKLADKAAELMAGGGQGWNGSPASNWHANTRSAAAICALAILNDQGAGDAADLYRKAHRGVLNYMQTQSGDRGWTQEGLGYYRYPLCHHLLPYLSIYRRLVDADGFGEGPGRWYGQFYLYIMPGSPDAPAIPVVNHDGRWEYNHWRSGDLAMAFNSVPPEVRPAMKWMFQRWYGEAGDGSYDIGLPHHALFALAHYPFDTPAADPDALLPRAWVDEKKGMYLFRNRWEDAGDAIVNVDLNRGVVGGTGRPVSGGAFTFTAEGGAWAVTGSKRRERGQYNVVQLPLTDQHAGAKTMRYDSRADGSATLTADLGPLFGRRAHGRVTRSYMLDYSGNSGSPAVLIVRDRLAKPTDATWRMHTLRKVNTDGNTFTMTAPNGATCRGTVLAPADARITTQAVDDEGGVTVSRIDITPADGKKTDEYLIVLTAQRGDAPAASSDGQAISVGDARYPFDGAAVVFPER